MTKKPLLLMFILTAFLVGCGSGTDSTLPQSVQGLFEITAVPAKSVFAREEFVSITFKVKNVSTNSVQCYQLGGGASDYNFKVLQNDRQVGPPSGSGGTTLPTPITYTYNAGDESSVGVGWDQRDVSGNQIGPGTYSLIFWYEPQMINGLTVSPAAAQAHLAAAPVTVTIQ